MTDSSTAPITEAERTQRVADTFVMLADTLVEDYDVVDVLDRLVKACVQLLGIHTAGMLLDDQRGALALVASSSERTHLLELFQVEHDDGPCLDCVRQGTVVLAADLEQDVQRWPAFAPAALQLGFRAVVAVPLRLRGQTIGSLGLFQDRPVLLEPADQRLAQAFADVATIGILQHRSTRQSALVAEQLRGALDSRVVIEQAKGVLAARLAVHMPDAFVVLRRYARNHNLKLTAAAEAVVRGEVDVTRM